MRSNKILIAAGGTGGHVFPALATAYELAENNCEVLFATDVRGEKYLEAKSFAYHKINSASPHGGALSKLKFIFKTIVGVIQSIFLILKLKPQIVIGFGGYPSFPPLIAAKILGKKIIIHEQNSVLGKVNKLLSRFTKTIVTSFPDTKFAQNSEYLGNPVRSEIIPTKYPEQTDKLKVFITGGSQGAKSFSELFPSVFEGIENIFVTQQAKAEDIEDIKNKYLELKIDCEVKAFFEDIDKKIAEANLIICRAGSSTISEIAVIGRPAIFIPLPTSADNHQLLNAQAIAKTAGAWVVEEKNLDKDNFHSQLRLTLGNYPALKAAAKNITSFAKPDAAKNLAKLIMSDILNQH